MELVEGEHHGEKQSKGRGSGCGGVGGVSAANQMCLHNCWDCPGKTVANVIKHLFTEGCLVFCTPGNYLIDLIFFF